MQRRCGDQIPGICAAVPVAAHRCYLVLRTGQCNVTRFISSECAKKPASHRTWQEVRVGRSRDVLCQVLWVMVGNVTVSLHLPTMATCSFTVGTPASSSHAGPHMQPPATGGRLSNILQICSIYLVNNALHCNWEQSRFGEERRSPRPRSAPRHRLRASVAGLGSGFPRDIRQQRRHSSDSLYNLHRWPHVRWTHRKGINI